MWPLKTNKIYNFDGMTEDPDNPNVIAFVPSLQDRVPAGRYAIVRTLSSRSLNDILSNALALELNGLIFLLSNSSSQNSEFSPSHVSDNEWEKIQYALYADQPQNLTNKQMYGPQTFRQKGKRLVIGAMFECREYAMGDPISEGNGIARIVNSINPDFICLDFDSDVWKRSGAFNASLVINQIILDSLQNMPRNPLSLVPLLNHYKPIFNILPPSTAGYENMLSRDGVYEVFQNGFTSPKCFGMPRVQPNYNTVEQVVSAWDWARFPSGLQQNVGRCEFVVDIRSNSTYASSFINQAVGSTPKSFEAGVAKNVSSGLIAFDDFESLLRLGSIPGNNPTSYWQYDGINVVGSYCIGWNKYPLLVANTNTKYQINVDVNGYILEDQSKVDTKIATAQDVTLIIENWKNGHVEGHRPERIFIDCALGLPNQNIDKNTKEARLPPVYPTTAKDESGNIYELPRTSVNSWLTFDNFVPFVSNQFVDKLRKEGQENYQSYNKLNLGGKPIKGDEGVYPLLITVTRVSKNQDILPADKTEASFFIKVNRSQPYNSSVIDPTDPNQSKNYSTYPFENDLNSREKVAQNFTPQNGYTGRGIVVFPRTYTPRIPLEWSPLNSWLSRNVILIPPSRNKYPDADPPTARQNSAPPKAIPSGGNAPASYDPANPTDPALRYFNRAPLIVRQAIAQAKWPWQLWDTAAAISELESGWDPTKENVTTQGGQIVLDDGTVITTVPEGSYGLFQINLKAHPNYTYPQILDPLANAMAGFEIYKAQGWGAWYISAKKLGLSFDIPELKPVPTTGTPNLSNLSLGILYPPFERGVTFYLTNTSLDHTRRNPPINPAIDLSLSDAEVQRLADNGQYAKLLTPFNCVILEYGIDPRTGSLENHQSGLGVRCIMQTFGLGVNLIITYGHMDAVSLYDDDRPKVGDQLLHGSFVGYMGSTGNSTAPHLHMEVKTAQYQVVDNETGTVVTIPETYQDPELFLRILHPPDGNLVG